MPQVQCEGGFPCAQCTARGQHCVADGPSQGKNRRDQGNGTANAGSSPPGTGPQIRSAGSVRARTGTGRGRVTTNELLDRLASMERQMNVMMKGEPSSTDDNQQPQAHAQSEDSLVTKSPESGLHAEDEDRQTFLGEISVRGLMQSTAQADDIGVQQSDKSPTSNCRPLTPKAGGRNVRYTHANSGKRSKSWLRETLFAYSVVPEQLDLERLLHIFLEEVHILYPFLHPPSVRQTLDILDTLSFLISLTELEEKGESKMSVALLFACLALGRCTASCRTDNVDGANSAGWSLCSVAMDLVGPLLDVTSGSAISLLALQVLTIMVRARYPIEEERVGY